MNQGLELLMNRMETHPEEFTDTMRWGKLLDDYEDVFDEEDIKVFRAKHNALHQQEFTAQVMKKLFEEEEKPTASPFGQAGMSQVGAIQGLYTAAGQAGMYTAQAQLAQQQLAMQNAAQNAYANVSTISLGNSNPLSNYIRLGDQTLTAKMIKKLKALIK